MIMYDLEKASKSAHGISLYVSDDPKGSNEVLGPDAPSFPDQDGALVYELPVQNDSKNHSKEEKPEAPSIKQQATLDSWYKIVQDNIERNKTYDT